jgi:hypothetical protein
MNNEEKELNISVVHLKHTGTELICDLLEFNEENKAVTIRHPMILRQVGASPEGQAQMGLIPFLISCADDVIHLSLGDILFIAECQEEIAGQYKQVINPSLIAVPDSKIII